MENVNPGREAVVESNIGLVHPVGEDSVAIVTRLNPTEEQPEYVGNILRRTCEVVGEAACKDVCQLRGVDPQAYALNDAKKCTDRNLRQGLDELGIVPGDVLMVAVTGDNVGFGDKLSEYRREGNHAKNPEGWTELKGFNAFFARAYEAPALGSRLADCAHLSFEFEDSEGNTVIGFEHGTRTNMKGTTARGFEVEGHPASYTEHVLSEAIAYYGADPQSVKVRLSSSIKPENFAKTFVSAEKMEDHLPGWFADGLVANATNPNWQPGDPINPEDKWYCDARTLILSDIAEAMDRLGIPAENFDCEGMIDPADSEGEFSSHKKRRVYGDSRDLYMVAHREAFPRSS